MRAADLVACSRVPRIRDSIETSPTNQYLVGMPTAEIHHVVKRYAGPALSATQSAALAATTQLVFVTPLGRLSCAGPGATTAPSEWAQPAVSPGNVQSSP
jgi:hypothetical protein